MSNSNSTTNANTGFSLNRPYILFTTPYDVSHVPFLDTESAERKMPLFRCATCFRYFTRKSMVVVHKHGRPLHGHCKTCCETEEQIEILEEARRLRMIPTALFFREEQT